MKKLAYAFIQLPYHKKVLIAAEMDLIEANDKDLTDVEKTKRFLIRAKEQNKLAELWDKVMDDNAEVPNPFKTPPPMNNNQLSEEQEERLLKEYLKDFHSDEITCTTGDLIAFARLYEQQANGWRPIREIPVGLTKAIRWHILMNKAIEVTYDPVISLWRNEEGLFLSENFTPHWKPSVESMSPPKPSQDGK